MAYRGEDLDLRTPQTWGGTPSDVAGASDSYTNGGRGRQAAYPRNMPILVDDIVLACSNHAFDVAVAHRAGEVRIEHLLHAMTRVDGASNALEARGIRVSGLRRESATIIAGEIPIGLGAGLGRPHRSDNFEHALRSASAIAYRRNAPANVDDVLDALLDMPSDVAGIALLARHGGRVARDRSLPRDVMREPSRDRERDLLPPFQPLPPLMRSQPQFSADSRNSEPIRKPAGTYYAADRPARTEIIGSQVDGLQNARIDQLENALRSLASEISNDRKAERDDAGRFRGNLNDRLQSLEQTVMSSANDGSDAGILLERLGGVERGLEQRLGELARPWGVLSDRLQGREQTILDTRGTKSGELASVQERLVSLERSVGERIKGLERSVDAVGLATLDLSPIANRLDIIEEAVLTPQASPDAERLAERLRALEEAVNAQRALVVQSNQALNNDVKALASALAGQSASNERVHSFVSDRIQTLTSGFERQRVELTGPLTERINALASSLDGRLQSMTGLVDRQSTAFGSFVDTRTSETQRAVASLAERMTALETNLTLSLDKAAEAQAVHTAELKEVHEALIKLNTNQHTLAGSIDQWRLDGVGDVSVIANRLEQIEKSNARPVQMLESLTTSVDNINRATVERYHRRNRVYYWLFGTDDWLTASWPSQVANIEAERQSLRGSVPKVSDLPRSSALRP